MKRVSSMAEVRADQVDEYRRLHREVWPDLLELLRLGNIRNYSIHLRKMADGRHILFSYFEYVGIDFATDMAQIDVDATMRRWWEVCGPCLTPPDGPEGEYFEEMEEVFCME